MVRAASLRELPYQIEVIYRRKTLFTFQSTTSFWTSFMSVDISADSYWIIIDTYNSIIFSVPLPVPLIPTIHTYSTEYRQLQGLHFISWRCKLIGSDDERWRRWRMLYKLYNLTRKFKVQNERQKDGFYCGIFWTSFFSVSFLFLLTNYKGF